MARKTTSRIEMRRQAEAAESQGDAPAATKEKKKTASAAKPKRNKEKPIARKRLIWVVYNGSMKEEGRFPYDQRAAAEEKIEQLRQKSKKLYFIQPVKELIGEPGATIGLAAAAAAAAAKVAEEEVEVPKDVLADVEVEDEEEDEEEDADE